MSNSNNNSVDPIKNAIAQQKVIEQNKNWKKSQIRQVKEEMNKELQTIENACVATIKDVENHITAASIRLQFESEKLAIKAEYQPKIEALTIALEDITQGAGMAVGDKVGAAVAPVTKSVKGFLSSLKSRAL